MGKRTAQHPLWSGVSGRVKKVVRHARYVIFHLPEVAIPRSLFAAILEPIRRLRPPATVPNDRSQRGPSGRTGGRRIWFVRMYSKAAEKVVSCKITADGRQREPRENPKFP